MVPIKSLPHRFGSWPLKAKLMLGFGLIIVMVVMLSGFALNGFNRVIEAFYQNDQVAGLNRQALESRIEQHRFNAEADLQALDRAVGLLKKMADTPIISSNEHSIAPLLTDYINSLDHQGDAAIRQRQARNNMESASSTVDTSMATLTEVIRNELALRISLYNDTELTSLFEQYQASTVCMVQVKHSPARPGKAGMPLEYRKWRPIR